MQAFESTTSTTRLLSFRFCVERLALRSLEGGTSIIPQAHSPRTHDDCSVSSGSRDFGTEERNTTASPPSGSGNPFSLLRGKLSVERKTENTVASTQAQGGRMPTGKHTSPSDVMLSQGQYSQEIMGGESLRPNQGREAKRLMYEQDKLGMERQAGMV